MVTYSAGLRRATLVALVSTFVATQSSAAPAGEVGPYISEFLASSEHGLLDAFGDTSDWIEITNGNSTSIDLGGWYLTDTAVEPTLYRLPSPTWLGAGQRLVVFASGRDTTASGGELHTNFKLSKGGEYLALVNPDESAVHEFAPAFPPQFTDISYGYQGGQFLFFETPTPGTVNGTGSNGVVTVAFSDNRGFRDNTFQLTLTPNPSDATVRYTLDGSKPSSSQGSIYSGPITVSDTTVVRAYGSKSGYISSPAETHTYIFIEDVVDQPWSISGYANNWYDVGGTSSQVQHDYQMDPNIVNNGNYSQDVRDGLLEIPTMSIAVDPDEIFGSGFYDASNVEEECSVEVLYPGFPQDAEQADAGIESHSHKRLKRSMRLNFRQEYGDPKFNTDLFKNAEHKGGPGSDVKLDRIILRGGNNRSWARGWNPDETTYAIDEFYRDSQIELSGFGPRGAFVHLYINGIYWGLYNPVERPDQYFSSTYFDGADEDWYARNHGGSLSGDSSRYNHLINTLAFQDLSSSAKYAELQEYLDVTAFADYLILCWWCGMGDWPSNNWYGGNREDGTEFGSTPFTFYTWDGEWSWDAPFGFSNPGHGAHVHPEFAEWQSGGAPITRVWHAARDNEEFMMLFADRVHRAVHNGGALDDQVAQDRWNMLNETLRNAVVAESARWGDALESLGHPMRTRNTHWQNQVNNIAGLLMGNAAVFIDALRDENYYPSIDAPRFSQHGGALLPSSTVSIHAASGTIYFTEDGSDPRATGGSISGSAQVYTGPLAFPTSMTIRARAKQGSEWSALTEATFVVGYHVRISEIMADNESTVQDEVGQYEDWIELENLSQTPLDIGGMYLTDNWNVPEKWEIPAGTILPASGHLLVWADEDVADGPLHANFKLSKSGEEIGLYMENGPQMLMLSGFPFGQQTTDASMGRLGGNNVLVQLLDPSPAADNRPTPGNTVRYQTAIPGVNTATLDALGSAVLGSSLTMQVAGGPPGQASFVLLGMWPLDILTSPASSLLILPAFPSEWAFFISDPSGGATVGLPIPATSGLAGVTLYAQGYFDSASEAMSNAVAFTLGS